MAQNIKGKQFEYIIYMNKYLYYNRHKNIIWPLDSAVVFIRILYLSTYFLMNY